MRALVTGGGGQLASDLVDLLGTQAHAFSHSELDITDTEALDRVFEQIDPDVVFNCAAFHNLDACESDPRRAWEVNVEAVRALSLRSPRLVHISTNYVFDGERAEPYGEFDLPSPRSVYAITKLAGEQTALSYGSQALVVRTGGLYGLHGSVSKGGNFVERMIARGRVGEIRMVADQFVQPTYTADLAAALVAAVQSGTTGVVHLTASGSCSWHDFTLAIIARAGIETAIEPVATTRSPGGVHRPLNGVLARPAADALGLPDLRPWEDGLADYMQRAGLAQERLVAPPGA